MARSSSSMPTARRRRWPRKWRSFRLRRRKTSRTDLGDVFESRQGRKNQNVSAGSESSETRNMKSSTLRGLKRIFAVVLALALGSSAHAQLVLQSPAVVNGVAPGVPGERGKTGRIASHKCQGTAALDRSSFAAWPRRCCNREPSIAPISSCFPVAAAATSSRSRTNWPASR